MNLNHPVVARLNPPRGDALPPGFTRFLLPLVAGLPTALPVTIPGANGQLMLGLPSGRVRHWLGIAADTEVAAGVRQREGRADPAPGTSSFAAARARTVPYLMLVIDRRLADAWPLITGTRQILENGPAGQRRALAEFMLSDFQINASALAGGAPGGCWIDLGVRALAASTVFRAPMLGQSQLQQAALQRSPDRLAFAPEFASGVETGALPDGTPVGGIDWWLSHGGN